MSKKLGSRAKIIYAASKRLERGYNLSYTKDYRLIGMPSITVNIADEQLEKLQYLARESQISLEDLLRASIADWLSYPKQDFSEAANYVLQKNAELYRRLA